MKTLLLGLLQGPVAWLALAAGVSFSLQQQGVPASATIGVSLLAGAFAWAAIGLLAAARSNWRQYTTLSGGVAGVAPTDGRLSVLVGTLEADGPVLRTPFDDRPCLVYRYAITDVRGTGRRRFVSNVFRGVALTASRILTRTGSYRLLTVPEFSSDGPDLTREQQIATFRDYAARVSFLPQSQGADELLAQWADDDGQYRSDVTYADADPGAIDAAHWVLEQHHIAPGTRVCAFGVYSREKGGLVPSVRHGARLMLGDATVVAATLRRTAVVRMTLALVLAGAAAGITLLFLTN